MIYLAIVLTAVIIYQGVIGYFNKQQLLEHIKESQVEYMKERQQLLDRIQAPSFDHLKQAEVRIIKAQKDEKKELPFELV